MEKLLPRRGFLIFAGASLAGAAAKPALTKVFGSDRGDGKELTLTESGPDGLGVPQQETTHSAETQPVETTIAEQTARVLGVCPAYEISSFPNISYDFRDPLAVEELVRNGTMIFADGVQTFNNELQQYRASAVKVTERGLTILPSHHKDSFGHSEYTSGQLRMRIDPTELYGRHVFRDVSSTSFGGLWNALWLYLRDMEKTNTIVRDAFSAVDPLAMASDMAYLFGGEIDLSETVHYEEQVDFSTVHVIPEQKTLGRIKNPNLFNGGLTTYTADILPDVIRIYVNESMVVEYINQTPQQTNVSFPFAGVIHADGTRTAPVYEMRFNTAIGGPWATFDGTKPVIADDVNGKYYALGAYEYYPAIGC